MGKYNYSVNRLLERKEVFADLLNGTVFGGRQEIRADRLEMISIQSGVVEEKDEGKLAALERRGDIRFKAHLRTYALILANETQKKVHYAMPVRNMLYDALEYTRQIQDLEKKNIEEVTELDKFAFLSGITKEDKLSPVITTVLYLDGEWDGPRSLYEMLDVDEADETWDRVKEYLPDYRINVITMKEIGDPEKFQTCLRQIFSLLQFNKDKKKLYSYIEGHREELSRMDDVETMAALIMLGGQKKVEQMLRENQIEKEDVDMCQALEELIMDGEMRGEARGEARGAAKGEERSMRLVARLIEDGKQYLIGQVAGDRALREQMFAQYQL